MAINTLWKSTSCITLGLCVCQTTVDCIHISHTTIHSDHSSLGSTLSYFPSKESVETASEYGDDVHTLGVIGIMFDVVDDRINPAFEAMFENETLHTLEMPHEDGDVAEIIDGLDLSQMIPDHLLTEGFYAYKGSLTTPPVCPQCIYVCI